MDRIKDSGSFDWGSTPHGFTMFCYKHLIISRMVGDGLLVEAISWRPFFVGVQ